VEKQYLLLVSALGLDTVLLLALPECVQRFKNVRELGSHVCGRVVLSVVFVRALDEFRWVVRLARSRDSRKNVGPSWR
jgi:hypothetical protein